MNRSSSGPTERERNFLFMKVLLRQHGRQNGCDSPIKEWARCVSRGLSMGWITTVVFFLIRFRRIRTLWSARLLKHKLLQLCWLDPRKMCRRKCCNAHARKDIVFVMTGGDLLIHFPYDILKQEQFSTFRKWASVTSTEDVSLSWHCRPVEGQRWAAFNLSVLTSSSTPPCRCSMNFIPIFLLCMWQSPLSLVSAVPQGVSEKQREICRVTGHFSQRENSTFTFVWWFNTEPRFSQM